MQRANILAIALLRILGATAKLVSMRHPAALQKGRFLCPVRLASATRTTQAATARLTFAGCPEARRSDQTIATARQLAECCTIHTRRFLARISVANHVRRLPYTTDMNAGFQQTERQHRCVRI